MIPFDKLLEAVEQAIANGLSIEAANHLIRQSTQGEVLSLMLLQDKVRGPALQKNLERARKNRTREQRQGLLSQAGDEIRDLVRDTPGARAAAVLGLLRGPLSIVGGAGAGIANLVGAEGVADKIAEETFDRPSTFVEEQFPLISGITRSASQLGSLLASFPAAGFLGTSALTGLVAGGDPGFSFLPDQDPRVRILVEGGIDVLLSAALIPVIAARRIGKAVKLDLGAITPAARQEVLQVRQNGNRILPGFIDPQTNTFIPTGAAHRLPSIEDPVRRQRISDLIDTEPFKVTGADGYYNTRDGLFHTRKQTGELVDVKLGESSVVAAAERPTPISADAARADLERHAVSPSPSVTDAPPSVTDAPPSVTDAPTEALDPTAAGRGVFESHSQFGGSTINPRTGDSLAGDDVWAVTAENLVTPRIQDQPFTDADVRAFIETPEVRAALKDDPILAIGTASGADTSTGVGHEINLTKTFDDHDAAIQFGVENNQYSILNLAHPEFKAVPLPTPRAAAGAGPNRPAVSAEKALEMQVEYVRELNVLVPDRVAAQARTPSELNAGLFGLAALAAGLSMAEGGDDGSLAAAAGVGLAAAVPGGRNWRRVLDDALRLAGVGDDVKTALRSSRLGLEGSLRFLHENPAPTVEQFTRFTQAARLEPEAAGRLRSVLRVEDSRTGRGPMMADPAPGQSALISPPMSVEEPSLDFQNVFPGENFVDALDRTRSEGREMLFGFPDAAAFRNASARLSGREGSSARLEGALDRGPFGLFDLGVPQRDVLTGLSGEQVMFPRPSIQSRRRIGVEEARDLGLLRLAPPIAAAGLLSQQFRDRN